MLVTLRQIFGLPQMEILDLSRNKISEIPSDIESLKALRVFSIQHNSIEDLPKGLGSTSTLRMLKMAGNPWEPGIKRILSTGDTTKDDNERDTMLTPTIKEYLRARAVKDSGEDAR
jgi:Leucine-rich repeat (LRR) protein